MLEIPDHIRGLIFDCDGTIADTMPLHYEAWSAAFAEQGRPFAESTLYEMAGMPTVKMIEILNQRHGYNLPVQQTADRKEELLEKLLHRVGPIEPVVKLVREYAGKLPMAVATGATREIVVKILEALELLPLFNAIVSASDIKNGKPAPDIFLEAARLLKVPAGDCCVFEDADLGLIAARAAGMMVVDIRPLVGSTR
jgi:beta-phosphoglucomutase family hydrolase